MQWNKIKIRKEIKMTIVPLFVTSKNNKNWIQIELQLII